MEHDMFGLVEVRKRVVTTLNFWQSKAKESKSKHALWMTRPPHTFSQFSTSLLFNVEETRKVTLGVVTPLSSHSQSSHNGDIVHSP